MSTQKIMYILISLFFVGCTGSHCIKVGGGYEGIQGDLEYCWGASGEMKSLEAPIVTSKNEKFIGISEKEANLLIEKIEPKEETSEFVLKAKEDVFFKLKKILKK